MELWQVDDRLSAASQPEPGDLRALARRGIRAVINLRDDEEGVFWTGAEEGERARRQGMDYAHVPLPPQPAARADLERCLDALRAARRPAVLHSGRGRRARLLAVLAAAIEARWSPDEALEKASALGLSDEATRALLASELATRQGEAADRAASARAAAPGLPPAQPRTGPDEEGRRLSA